MKYRKNDEYENTYLCLSLENDQALAIRQKLLESLIAEPVANVRNKITDAVAELARQYTEKGPCHCAAIVRLPCCVGPF